MLALTYELTIEFDPEKSLREDLSNLKIKTVVGQGNIFFPLDKNICSANDELFSDEEERLRLQAEKLPGFYKGGSSEDEDEDNDSQKQEDDRSEENMEDSEDDEDDWITPDNIKEIDDGDALEEEKEDTVACLTIDFAMQNVLLKYVMVFINGNQCELRMDLGRVGLEGRKISQIRKYVFRCIGCKFIDKTASKVFCPSCGHRTMRRVACEVQPDGTLKLFLAKNPKVLSSRGTKYALPNPKVISISFSLKNIFI